MFSEIDFQTTAQNRQATLLAEASARQITRVDHNRPTEALPAGRRLQTLLRRLAGAPTFA